MIISSPKSGEPAPGDTSCMSCVSVPAGKLAGGCCRRSVSQAGEWPLWYLSPLGFLYRLPHTLQK